MPLASPHAAPLLLTHQDQTKWELCIQGKCSRHGGESLSGNCRPFMMVGVLNLYCSSLRSIVSEKRWILGMGLQLFRLIICWCCWVLIKMELKSHVLKSAACYIQKTENTAPVQTRAVSVFLILWFWVCSLHFGPSPQGSS